MKKVYTLFVLLFATILCFGQDIFIGKRDTVSSVILKQERELSIYLPPSYYASPNQKYPVLYILDGDYNFQYVAGLMELEGGISERIPELILVAISGKDSETYKQNCKPNLSGIEDSGNADKMAEFIAKELIPHIDSEYKTNGYKILAGHSLGGLFVTNTAINHPDLFNNYIAISPALWWESNAINQVGKQKIKGKYTTPKVYTSLGNEKGMGVGSFLGVATSSIFKNNTVIYAIGILFILVAIISGVKRKKVLFPVIIGLVGIALSACLMFCYYPQNDNFKFKKFSKENHNSVGVPSYRWALEEIFSPWRVEAGYFSSVQALIDHTEKVQSTYGTPLNLPRGVWGYTYFVLKDNPTELSKMEAELRTNHPNAFEEFNLYRASKILEDEPKESEELIKGVLKLNPRSAESYHLLSKIKLIDNQTVKADSLIKLSISLTKEQKQRQWKMNELTGTENKIVASHK